jgi:hypothetical protein
VTSFHRTAMIIWGVLAIPTMLWWKDSILWVAMMSLYANFVGHWAAYQAAKSDQDLKAAVGNSPNKDRSP